MQTTLIVIAVALLALGAALTIAPRTMSVSSATTGDTALAAEVRQLLGDSHGYQTLSVAVITKDTIRYAGLGDMDGRTPIKDTPFELGSITKTFDGMLLADAITRGEVHAEDPLATYLPELAGTPMGGVTLAELVSHRGGVPPLPPTVVRRAIPAMITDANPFALTPSDLIGEASKMELLETRGSANYSNLGASLLGHALAAAAGEPDWRRYVSDRLLTPLGLGHTVFAITPDEVPAEALTGLSDTARRLRPWTSEAFAPAGVATWTTPVDLANYAQAILAGRAPGMTALTPRWEFEGTTKVGYAWFTSTTNGHQITGHDGGTNGYRTFLGIDLEAGKAVLIAGNTNREVTPLALAVLAGVDDPIPGPDLPIDGLILLGLAVALGALSAWMLASGTDILGLIGHGSFLVGLLAFTRVEGEWGVVPGWTWALLVAGSAAAIAVGIRRLKPLLSARGRAWWRWLGTGLAVVLGWSVLIATL